MILKTLFPFKKTLISHHWSDLKLTEGLSDKAPYVDLSKDYTIEEACAYLSEGLTFVEKVKVAHSFSNQVKTFSTAQYFKNCGLHHDSLISDIETQITHLPESFIDWAKSKSLGPKDFRAFIYENIEEHKLTFSHLSSINPTKMNGLKILELLFDLYSLSKFSEAEFLKITSEKKALKILNKKRFPLSQSFDENLEKRFSQIALPKDIKISIKREGDQNKMIVTLKSSHPKELNKKLLKFTKDFSLIEKAWGEENL